MVYRCMATAAIMILLIGVGELAANPPDPPLPNEDVLRPRLPGSDAWFGQIGAGLNITMMSGNPTFRSLAVFEGRSDLYESASGIGPLLYGALGYRYTPNFSIRVRLDLDRRRVDNEASSIDTCLGIDPVSGRTISVPFPATKAYDIAVTYLTMSLLPAYHVDDVYLFAGPAIGVPVTRTVHETNVNTDTSNPCFYLPFTPDATKSIEGSLPTGTNTATRIALKVGAGYTIRVAPGVDLVPEIGLDIGLGETFERNADGSFEVLQMTNPDVAIPIVSQNAPINNAIRLHTLQLTIGVRFGL